MKITINTSTPSGKTDLTYWLGLVKKKKRQVIEQQADQDKKEKKEASDYAMGNEYIRLLSQLETLETLLKSDVGIIELHEQDIEALRVWDE